MPRKTKNQHFPHFSLTSLINQGAKEIRLSLWKDVGKADIAGAAAVGVESVIAGLSGWVGGIATVVSGALSASMYGAIYQFF